MLALMDMLVVSDLAQVGHVGQQDVDVGLIKGLAPHLPALAALPALGGPAATGQFIHRPQQRLLLQVEFEDLADPERFFLVDHQSLVDPIDVVAEDRPSACPFTLLSGGGDLVAGPLTNDLPFELGEGQEDVQGQPTHGVSGIEVLGHADEVDVLVLKELHQSREVQERPGKAIDLVDDNAVHSALGDVSQQFAQRRPVRAAARVSAIVILFRNDHPTGMSLGGDVGLARLALGVERVEGLIQSLAG